MNYTESNKLIAEFMGLTVEDNEWVVINEGQGVHREYRTQARYHQSWDWLMPVIKKIGEIDLFDYEPFDSVSLYSSIELVYESAVEAIEWYNENK